MMNGLLFAFGILATGLSIVFLDEDLAIYFHNPAREYWLLRARSITNIALGENWFGVAILVFIACRFLLPRISRFDFLTERFKNLERWAAYFFLSLLGSGIILQLAKISFGRERPHVSDVPQHLAFTPFTLNWHHQSMPSGHAQVIFAAATSFCLLWPRLAWLFYSLASILAFTRVMTIQHFMSDIIAGAMIGYFGSLWVQSLLEKKISRPQPFSFRSETKML